MFFLLSYFNAYGMGISVTEIQTNLHIWACCNQIKQHSPFISSTKWLKFVLPFEMTGYFFVFLL